MSASSAAQLGLGLVGAAIGGAIVPGIGASIGFSLGAMAGGLLVPQQLPDQVGPRLDDLSVSGSGYGSPIPLAFGTIRMSCNMIWTSGKIETKHDEEVGGKGAPSQTVTTYTYSMSAAYAICEGPIVDVRRVWINSNLVYDHSDTASGTALRVSVSQAASVNIYDGSETQLPSGLQEAYEGVGNVPAYRGIAVIEFEDLQLADFGNGPISVEVEVVRSTAVSSSVPPTQVSTLADATTFCTAADDQGTAISAYWYNDTLSTHAEFIRWVRHSYDGTLLEQSDDFYFAGVSGSYYTHVNICQNDPTIYLVYKEAGEGKLYKGKELQGNPVNPFNASYSSADAFGGQQASSLRFDGHNIVRYGMDIYTLTREGWLAADQIGIAKWNIVIDDLGIEAINTGAVERWRTLQDLGLPAGFNEVFSMGIDDEGFIWIGWFAPSVSLGNYKFIKLNSDLEVVNHWSSCPYLGRSPLIYYLNSGNVISIGAFKSVFTPKLYVTEFDPSDNNTTFEQREIVITPEIGGVFPYGRGFFKVGNQIWSMEDKVAQGDMGLDEIVAELMEKVGHDSTDYDVTDLSTVDVKGYKVGSAMAARNAIEPLQRAYLFDVPLIDNKLVTVRRGKNPTDTIPVDDLAAHMDTENIGDTLSILRQGELELPRRVVVKFLERGANYEVGERHTDRLAVKGSGISTIDVPLVLTATEAARLSEQLLFLAYAERDAAVNFSISGKYYHLTASDVVSVGDDLLRIRIDEINTTLPLKMDVTGTLEKIQGFTSSLVGIDNTNVSSALFGVIGPSGLVALDIPILSESHDNSGIYLASWGYLDGWRGSVVYRSTDSGLSYTPIETFTSSARQGKATTLLASGRTDTWDRVSTVTIRVSLGLSLSSASEISVLNGANSAAFGIDGRWEILQWATAVDNGDGTFTLSNLLRGRYGTEHNTGNHGVGDTFVALNRNAVIRSLMPQNSPFLYKAVSIGTDLQDAQSQVITNTGVGQMPLSVCQVTSSRSGTDIVINWERRSRYNYQANMKLPLGETIQEYEIEFWDVGETTQYGATKVVTLTLTDNDPTYTYTTALQTSDSVPTPGQVLLAKIYQISSTIGRGNEWKGTV